MHCVRILVSQSDCFYHMIQTLEMLITGRCMKIRSAMKKTRKRREKIDYIQLTIKESAKKVSYRNLKKEHNHVIRYYVLGKDVVFLKYSESPCLPLLFNILNHHDNAPYSVVIIVSPLIALMNDKISKMASKCVSAVSITSSDTDNDHKWEYIVKGHFNIKLKLERNFFRPIHTRSFSLIFY